MHLFAIPTVMIANNIIGTFTNTMMIFILRDPNYFNVPATEIGTVSNNILFWGIIANMIGSLFIGQIFDIVGRKWTLFFAVVFSGLFLALVPLAPNVYPWLVIFRMGIAISMVGALCMPLITDYIKKNSRGKATAF